MNDLFRKFATITSQKLGSPFAFITALALLIVWAVSGPIFKFSDTWQLVINTSTTIITFLMVFLIQNTQNRDSKSIQLKLDELIYHVKGAHNKFAKLEEMDDKELKKMTKKIDSEFSNRKKAPKKNKEIK